MRLGRMANKMKEFSGFPSTKGALTPLPDAFFSELLPLVDDMGELKVILYALWLFNKQEGNHRFLIEQDFLENETVLNGLGKDARTMIQAGLKKALEKKILLAIQTTDGQYVYLPNSARGQAAIKAAQAGAWQPLAGKRFRTTEAERPNIFKLYEENIGPLTPLIADTLQEAEQAYAPDWIEEAIRLAVQKNVRNWRYIEGILSSWKEKGRHETPRQDSQENRRRYIEGEYSDLIEH